MDDSVRIDKWLWAVRIFKTRSDAAEACRTNRVTLNGSYTKPSREIKPGDTVTVRKTLVTYSFRVLALVSSRQGAKNVPEYMEDITPPEELNKLNVPRETIFVQRDRGMGRPTKRERREIDALMGDLSSSDGEAYSLHPNVPYRPPIKIRSAKGNQSRFRYLFTYICNPHSLRHKSHIKSFAASLW
mgnify:CR=1 FL=1